MKYETKVQKSRLNGWGATSTIELEKISDTETRILEFSTYKNSTTASVHVLNKSGALESKSFMMFQDYSERIERPKVSRATEKTILAAHHEAMKDAQKHLDAANLQYGTKAAFMTEKA